MRTSTSETSNGFRGEFFFLSNFFEAPVSTQFKGESFIFATGEHLFQGMKIGVLKSSSDPVELLRKLEAAPTPGKAKYWGRSRSIDLQRWDRLAYKAMERTVELKFKQHPKLAERLRATGDLQLVEWNSWGDRRWGKDQETGEGANLLGQILMAYRSSLI